MTLTTRIKSALTARVENTIDTGTSDASHVLTADISYADGTGAGMANRIWSDTRTLAADGTENLDLAGSLVDVFGSTITFAKVKAIKVTAAAANTNSVIVGSAVLADEEDPNLAWATLFNDHGRVAIRPGGVFLAACGEGDATGWAVTAATGDLLTITNSGGTTGVTYTIVIVGTSA